MRQARCGNCGRFDCIYSDCRPPLKCSRCGLLIPDNTERVDGKRTKGSVLICQNCAEKMSIGMDARRPAPQLKGKKLEDVGQESFLGKVESITVL